MTVDRGGGREEREDTAAARWHSPALKKCSLAPYLRRRSSTASVPALSKISIAASRDTHHTPHAPHTRSCCGERPWTLGHTPHGPRDEGGPTFAVVAGLGRERGHLEKASPSSAGGERSASTIVGTGWCVSCVSCVACRVLRVCVVASSISLLLPLGVLALVVVRGQLVGRHRVLKVLQHAHARTHRARHTTHARTHDTTHAHRSSG